MVYILVFGYAYYYHNYTIVRVFSHKEDAERFLKKYKKCDFSHCYWIIESEVL